MELLLDRKNSTFVGIKMPRTSKHCRQKRLDNQSIKLDI